MKNQVGFVLCGSLQFQLGARKPAFVCFQTSDRIYVIFFYFNYNSAVFQRNNLTRQIALIQCSGR